MNRHKQNITKRILITFLAVCSTVLIFHAQNSPKRERYGYGLRATGSENPAFTIYTNPAQDCSTGMNISWATTPGLKWEIELRDETSGETFLYDYESFPANDSITTMGENGKMYCYPFVYRCETYNNIKSKLVDNKDVYEKHIFDKHGFELFDLEPDKDYSYRIVTFKDSTDEKQYSDTYRFRTAGADSWKAAVIGDFHHYSPLWSRLDAAMDMVDVIDSVAGGVDWVLSTGDQCAAGGMYNCWTELSEQPNYKNRMWASVQGNHDHSTLDNKKKSDDFFRDSHFFPWNGFEGQEGATYWFKYGDVLFIMLNNEASRGKGWYTPTANWIEKVVNGNPSKYIVVVEHHQWIIGQDGTSSRLDNFYKLFDKLGVDLAIAGHNHVYLRTYPLKDRQKASPEEGTYYVVNSSSDGQRGRDAKPLVANKNIIEKRWSKGSKTVGGMLMDVNPERIEMTLYDIDGTVQDTFTVPAKL